MRSNLSIKPISVSKAPAWPATCSRPVCKASGQLRRCIVISSSVARVSVTCASLPLAGRPRRWVRALFSRFSSTVSPVSVNCQWMRSARPSALPPSRRMARLSNHRSSGMALTMSRLPTFIGGSCGGPWRSSIAACR